MKKRVLSAALAVTLLFGSAAALPQDMFSDYLSIRSSASNESAGFADESEQTDDGMNWDKWYIKEVDEQMFKDEKISGNESYYRLKRYFNPTAEGQFVPHAYTLHREDEDGFDSPEDHVCNIIGTKAFLYSGLADVEIDYGFTEIESQAFYNCYSLKRIVIPKTVAKIGEKAIGYNDEGKQDGITIFCYKGTAAETYAKNNGISYTIMPSGYGWCLVHDEFGVIELCDYNGTDKDIVVPATFGLWKVDLNSDLFEGCKTIETLTIEEGLETIPQTMCKGCSNLKSVKLPSTIKEIKSSAFYSCKSLTDINFPSSLKQIGIHAFDNCTSLKSVKLNNGLEKIHDCAFADSGLTSLNIPSGVTYIGEDAFDGTPWLEEMQKKNPLVIQNGYLIDAKHAKGDIVVPSGVKLICDSAFTGHFNINPDIDSVKIPSSVKVIDSNAFNGCNNMTSVTLSEGLEKIGYEAFFYCNKLKSISVPKSVTSIDYHALGYTEVYTSGGDYPYYETKKIDGFTIICYENSAAHKYAKENGFNVELNKWVKYEAKKPTCTKAGNIEYWKYGGKYYTAKDFSKQITQDKTVIPATDHQGKWIINKKATCTTDGSKTIVCTACGVKETRVIKATGHDWGEPEWDLSDSLHPIAKFVCKNDKSHVLNVQGSSNIDFNTLEPATCEKDGRVKMYLYAHIGNTQYKSFVYLVVPSSGHTFTNVKYTWSSDNKTCTATGKCSECGKNVSSTVAANYTITKAPTTSAAGSGTYKAVFHNYGLKDQTKTVVIPKEALVWGTPTYKWSADGKSCTATRVAKNDPTKKQTETSAAVYRVASAPGCSHTGTGEYTATFKNKAFTSQTRKVTIAKKAHSWGEWKTTKAATCTTTGTKQRTCLYCDQKQTATIAAKGHKWGTASYSWTNTSNGYKCTAACVCQNDKSHKLTETVEATRKVTKAPTTTATGTAVYTAAFKDSKFKTQTKTVTIAKEKYVWNSPVYTWTKTSKGYSCTATRTAKNDKKMKQTETIAASYAQTKAPTCTVKGAGVYTATFKNVAFSSQKKTVEIAAKAHKYSDWTTTSFNVSKGTSTQKRTCSVCKKVETKTVNGTVTRYAGSDRFATAALISNKNKSGMYTTANTVILASGMTFNDALAAVPLAKAYNAPLLLSAQRYIPTDTLNEIKRLKAKEIIVVNTNGAISAAAINTLKKSYKVTQITGKTCYETASKVATSLQAKIKSNTKGKTTIPDSIFFVVDDKFADALSVSPVAAIKGAPIIYVKSTGNLNSSTTNYLNNLKGKVKNVYIVGGTVAISTAVENKIKTALGVKSTVRFAGSDRYETCTKINTYFKSILKTNAVCIAKGHDFPDALAGGVFAANNAVPLLLADNRLYDPQTKYLKGKTVNKIYIFGGEVAVPTKLAQTIATASV